MQRRITLSFINRKSQIDLNMQPVINKIDQFVTIGIIWADGIDLNRGHDELERRLLALLNTRKQPLTDSQLTKTNINTRQIGVAIYYPAGWDGEPRLKKISDEFAELLSEVSEHIQATIL